ncbi:2-hydroxyacid dehydrogenase [Paenibacillus mendelii]|uniref:2-hydroxyacid dehydrogenase n=1 Tax=Paenibacillus mendelii TaxID=206163 RepID=A0ABV6J9J5_9BACL|nr:2-hydroxyacid dehydrogenase [Paenibacillus mendelii]MCQ6561086.1 2-hydroxyacid dehydrogenase [Paenibacillus mendelii]
MKRKAVLITAMGEQTFTAGQRARLEAAGIIQYHRSLSPLSPEQLTTLLKDADVAGLTPRSVPVIDKESLGGLTKLKGITIFATGVDYIDTAWLEKQGIALVNLPEYSTISVAEHTMGLLLTLSRRIHLSQDRVRGRVPAGTSLRGWELRGKTIGLIGLGRIGSCVAELAAAFGMRVLGYDPRPERAAAVTRVDLEELLTSSDIVSLHYPSSWGSSHSFGASQLSLMKQGAVLINVSRSALVEDEAVVDAIEQGRLRGYAVDDRFSLADRAQQLIAEGRIVQTGHTAWYSDEVIERGYEAMVNNVIGLLTGDSEDTSSLWSRGMNSDA